VTRAVCRNEVGRGRNDLRRRSDKFSPSLVTPPPLPPSSRRPSTLDITILSCCLSISLTSLVFCLRGEDFLTSTSWRTPVSPDPTSFPGNKSRIEFPVLIEAVLGYCGITLPAYLIQTTSPPTFTAQGAWPRQQNVARKSASWPLLPGPTLVSASDFPQMHQDSAYGAQLSPAEGQNCLVIEVLGLESVSTPSIRLLPFRPTCFDSYKLSPAHPLLVQRRHVTALDAQSIMI
jgi:hypothetical protein